MNHLNQGVVIGRLAYINAFDEYATILIKSEDDLYDEDKKEWVKHTQSVSLRAFNDTAPKILKNIKHGDLVSCNYKIVGWFNDAKKYRMFLRLEDINLIMKKFNDGK